MINHPNPFALIILIAKGVLLKKGPKGNIGHDERLLADKLKIVKLILGKKLPAPKERALMNFLFYYIEFEFSETKATFDYEVNLLINKNTKDMITFEELLIEDAQMDGYIKGKKEAKLEAIENEVFRLITKLGFSDQQIADYADLSLKLIKKIRGGLKAKKMIH